MDQKIDPKLEKAIDEALAKEKKEAETPKLRPKAQIVSDYWQLATKIGDLEYRNKLIQSNLQELYLRMNQLDSETAAPDEAPAPTALTAVPDQAPKSEAETA